MPLTDDQRIEIESRRGQTAPARRATVPALKTMLFEAMTALDHDLAWGRRLDRCRLKRKAIAVAMHHGSVDRQDVCTLSALSEVHRALARLHEGTISPVSDVA